VIQERIKCFLEYKGITKYYFYKKTNLSNGFLDKKGTIGVDKCEIIYYHFPEISLEWLVTGKGEMLKHNKTDDTKDIKIEENEELKTMKEKIEMMEKLLKLSEKIIESKEEIIKSNNKLIELLEKDRK
jgi:hypothetical protein